MTQQSDAPITPADLARIRWHTLSSDDALAALDSQRQGLSSDEVAERQRRFGRNVIPLKRGPGILAVIIRQFRNPLIYVLLIAGVVSLAIGETLDAAFIFGVLALNAAVGAFQEWQAETGAQALQEVVKVRATVRRGTELEEVDEEELVPGDIIALESGASVPADARTLSVIEASVDESILTGESVPVRKGTAAIDDIDATVGDRLNMLHAGTSLVSGRVTAVVCATGETTQIGAIASSLSEASAEPPLVVRLKRFTTMLTVVLLALILALGAAELARGSDAGEVFILAVALAVAAIPEGLPVGVTIALSIASRRMSKRDVIVRLLPAVEGLGACTVIATDKTGTLTVNRMTVKRIGLPDGTDVEIEGEGLALTGSALVNGEPATDDTLEGVKRLASASVLCNEASLRITDSETVAVGDTVDASFLVLGEKLGLRKLELDDQSQQLGMTPFESERRCAVSYNESGELTVASVKGAIETVLDMCPTADRPAIERQAEEMAAQGYRVIAIASGAVQAFDHSAPIEQPPKGLEFLGIAGLIDPVRPDVPEAIEKCHSAGVSVKMVTGDHPTTALAIARQLGIADRPEQVVHGREMMDMDGDGEWMSRRIREANVFARVEPGQKTKIVTALQDSGHFVAVTGDGVNDAPALKAANIGISMGRGGTDVARGASDLILTDDNFASIVDGIEEGRAAYDNVRKIIWYLLATAMGELTLFLISTITGLPAPLTPVQLLWLNVVTEGIQDVALAFEKREPGVLGRPPRPPSQQIFDRRMIEQVLLGGAIMGGVAFGLFYWLHEGLEWDEFSTSNMVLLLMVLFENVHVFNSRSETRSAFRVPFAANPFVVMSAVLAQGLHIVAMYTPGLRDALDIEPVSLGSWAAMVGLALTLLLAVEAYKWAKRHRPPDGAGLREAPA